MKSRNEKEHDLEFYSLKWTQESNILGVYYKKIWQEKHIIPDHFGITSKLPNSSIKAFINASSQRPRPQYSSALYSKEKSDDSNESHIFRP